MQVRPQILAKYTVLQLAACLLAAVVAGFINVGLGYRDVTFVTPVTLEATVIYGASELLGSFFVFYAQALRESEKYWTEAPRIAAIVAIVVSALSVLTTDTLAWYWIFILRLIWYVFIMALSGVIAKSALHKAH